MQPIVAPWPGMTPRLWFVRVYDADPHTWRGDLSLLQFLRRSSKDGQVLDWLQREHSDYPDGGVPLADFGSACPRSTSSWPAPYTGGRACG